jgi:hypothetical protein
VFTYLLRNPYDFHVSARASTSPHLPRPLPSSQSRRDWTSLCVFPLAINHVRWTPYLEARVAKICSRLTLEIGATDCRNIRTWKAGLGITPHFNTHSGSEAHFTINSIFPRILSSRLGPRIDTVGSGFTSFTEKDLLSHTSRNMRIAVTSHASRKALNVLLDSTRNRWTFFPFPPMRMCSDFKAPRKIG